VPRYADIIHKFGTAFAGRRLWDFAFDEKSMHKEMLLHTVRYTAIHRFGFVIPSRELLDQLQCHQPILEVGAGSGYITALMRHRGIDVIGTDALRQNYGFVFGAYDANQLTMNATEAVRRFPDRNVFCAWPTLGSTWLRYALQAMTVGRRAILIEESACAEPSTWQYRDRCFGRESSIDIPIWPGMHDYAATWIKKPCTMRGK